MKKAVIVLNGDPCEYGFDDGFIICCDGAFNYLKKINVKPDLILGDFDSLGFVPDNARVFPTDKDYTDGELALKKCIEKGFESVDFICSGGGRDDHYLGNLALLRQAFENGLKARLFTAYSVIEIVSESFVSKIPVGTTVSVVALENTIVKKSLGLKYEYLDTVLHPSRTLGISNIAIKSSVSIELKSGLVAVIINR